jgi:predicted phage-related endonuclease
MSIDNTVSLSQEEKILLIKAIQENKLDQAQKDQLVSIIETLSKVCATLEEKRASIKRLRNILGIKTEKLTSKSEFDEILKENSSNEVQKKRLKNQKSVKIRMGISPFLFQSKSK